jgi:hypothetical protein
MYHTAKAFVVRAVLQTAFRACRHEIWGFAAPLTPARMAQAVSPSGLAVCAIYILQAESKVDPKPNLGSALYFVKQI